MRRRRFYFDRKNPEPRAICDQCGFEVFHSDLREQRDYRGGDAPVGLGFLVCGSCYDQPQPYFARPRIKQDPTPVRNPRPPEPIPLWILAFGAWNDQGTWVDTDRWRDS